MSTLATPKYVADSPFSQNDLERERKNRCFEFVPIKSNSRILVKNLSFRTFIWLNQIVVRDPIKMSPKSGTKIMEIGTKFLFRSPEFDLFYEKNGLILLRKAF